MKRCTYWYDVEGNLTQLSVGVLDPETWDVLAVVTEHVGPFESGWEIEDLAVDVAISLAQGQYPGQQALRFD